jgi:hypothetical protein
MIYEAHSRAPESVKSRGPHTDPVRRAERRPPLAATSRVPHTKCNERLISRSVRVSPMNEDPREVRTFPTSNLLNRATPRPAPR